MGERDLVDITKDYLKAVEERDLSRCLDFFTEDATIDFQEGIYQGKEQVREWHRERFNANFKIKQLEQIERHDNIVTIDAVITSDRLMAWRIESLSGTATIYFEGDKIKEMKFAMRVYNPLEGW